MISVAMWWQEFNELWEWLDFDGSGDIDFGELTEVRMIPLDPSFNPPSSCSRNKS